MSVKIDQETIDAVKAELRKNMELIASEKNDANVKYVDPIQDPFNKAIKYLEEHNILQLFQGLTANIVYTKPAEPLEYILDEISDMKKNNTKLPAPAEKED